jgi:regulator of protease activity HflC (stomatin/prohibitin superfamily)
MSIWVWLTIILIVGGIILIAAGALTDEDGSVAIGSGVLAIILALVIFFGAGFKEVPVKTVGVVTAFGHIDGFMGPGIHHTWPWKTVNLLPETIQTTTFEGGFTKAGSCLGLDVRIGGQQQGCLDATIQWQVRDSAADTLFNNYNTGGSVLADISNAVVVREFKVAVNDVLGDYNPIQDVSLNSAAGNSQFSTFGPKIEALMKRDIGSEITVRTVLVPFLHYDNATQARLNAIQQQYGNTAIAQQEIKTNQAQSQANAAIARSVASPNVLFQECLNITELAVKSGVTMDTGWNCFGGSALALSGK